MIEPLALVRLALIVAMAVLAALVVRLAVARRRNPAFRTLPWWGSLGWLGYIAVSATSQVSRLDEGSLSWRWWLLAGSTGLSLAAIGRLVRLRRPPAPPDLEGELETIHRAFPTTRMAWLQLLAWLVMPAVLAASFMAFLNYQERQRCRDSIQARGEIRGAVAVAVNTVVVETQDEQTAAALAGLAAEVDANVRQVYEPLPPCVERLGLDGVEVPSLADVIRDE